MADILQAMARNQDDKKRPNFSTDPSTQWRKEHFPAHSCHDGDDQSRMEDRLNAHGNASHVCDEGSWRMRMRYVRIEASEAVAIQPAIFLLGFSTLSSLDKM